MTFVMMELGRKLEDEHVERLEKRGLSLARLGEIISGPQHWRQARRTYIQRILYRVAVSYWVVSIRYDGANETNWDSAWRRENNKVFTEGIRSVFDQLST